MSRMRRDRYKMVHVLVHIVRIAIIGTYHGIALHTRDFSKMRDLGSPRPAFLATGETYEVIGSVEGGTWN